MERETLTIRGMSCEHCVAAVRRTLDGLEGVRAEHVEIGTATILRDPDAAPLGTVAAALSEEGFALETDG
ncbi:MAG: heavy-metal-associated domain-containing protein [Rubricoccaceae bacterium]